MNSVVRSEPVSLASAVSAAMVATVNVLGLVLDWSSDLIAGLNLAIGAWVVVAALWVRALVSPVVVEADPDAGS